MTKRILILFMVVAIVLVFAACTEVNTTAKPKATTPATTKATTVATTTEATTVPTTAPTTAPTTVTTVTTVPTTVTTTLATVTTVTTATAATTAATTTAATTTAATTTAATTTAATTTAATTTAATTTAATTTAATTTAATTTAATTTAATTTAATTTAATAAITAGDVYVDLDFDNNAITDKKGNVKCTPVGKSAVKEVEVIHNGVAKTVNALVINDTTKKSWVECTFTNLVDHAQLNKLVAENKGWTVEAFYLNKDRVNIVGIVCVTEGNVAAYGKQGWGLADNAGNPYFLCGKGGTSSWYSTGKAGASSTTELCHVVAVHDAEAKTNTVYLNGAKIKSVAAAGFTAAQATSKDGFVMGTGFFLGGDPTVSTNASTYCDYPATNLTIVDVKIYAGALNATKVAEVYAAATADYKAEEYTASPQAPNAPTETAGKGPFLWLDFEKNNIKDGVIDNMAGDGLNATITGKPEYITSPTGGSAIYFGKGDTFDYLTIANNEKLNFGISDDFTIDFWYMIESTNSTWENLFSKGKNKDGWYGVWLSTNNNAKGGICWGGDTGNHQIASKYTKKTWQHVTVIKKAGTLLLYLNGALVKTLNAPDFTSDTNLYIGGMNSSYESGGVAQSTIKQGQFHGAIDDFKIYDYAWETDVKVNPLNSAKSFTYNFTNANNQKITLPYRVYFPTDYETSGKDYPVVLFLHGHGECGTDNCNQLQVFGANVFLDEIAEMDNCIIVAPQTYCDGATNFSEWVASGAGVSSGHVWDRGMPIRPGTLDETIHTVGMQAVEALFKDFIKNNRVDENRVYVGGISMGGCGTWEIIARNPDLFAAAVPLCGSGILSTAASLKNIDIWAFHGTADHTVLPEGTAKMAEAIQAAGGTKIIYTPLAGQGHSIWNAAYTTKNAAGQTPAQWLLQQTKAD